MIKRGLKKHDHDALRAQGRRVSSGPVLLSYIPDAGDDLIYGFTIGKKHGNAVTRNRIRRRLDAALRDAVKDTKCGMRLVIIPLRGQEVLSMDYDDLVQVIRGGINRD
jgi:ribonuclease P protein component